MRLGTVVQANQEKGAIVQGEKVYLLETINEKLGTTWETALFSVIQSAQLEGLKKWYNEGGKNQLETVEALEKEKVTFGPLYRHPRKIWGTCFRS